MYLQLKLWKRVRSDDIPHLYNYIFFNQDNNKYVLSLNWIKSQEIYKLLREGLFYTIATDLDDLPEIKTSLAGKEYRRISPKSLLVTECVEISANTFYDSEVPLENEPVENDGCEV